MKNVTVLNPSVLTLGFGEMTEIKYLYAVISLIFYILIIFCNVTVISTISLQKRLHEPMYTFIAALCINGLFGSSAFFPNLFFNLLQERQTISYIGCLTQIYCIHMYMGWELTILAAMGFDRYVSICRPLRYHSIMSMKMVLKLVIAACLYNFILFSTHFALTVRLPLCDSVILKIYCDNWSVVRLSCIDTTLNNIYGISITVAFIGFMPVLIMASYIKILIVCLQSSKATREKALQTCSPHLITLINYMFDVLFEIILHRYKPSMLSYEVRVAMSVQFLTLPPLLNPLIYGLKCREIRVRITQLFQKKSKTRIS
uniref:G-protein coupled receptors family 1 profile domain-containing protein n=1 Tax=Leptobrachium leishanense TaxID=445787 RepID=A0A8C5MJR6_9ANUR